MAMAITLREYLDELDITYDIVKHDHTYTSLETAAAAHVPGDKLVKSVILKDGQNYLMAIVPSTCHIQLSDFPAKFNRHMQLVPEAEISRIFTDCDIGAIPPIGPAYSIDMIVDNKLLDCDDIYIEAGDHESLLHLGKNDFMKLVANSPHGEFTRHI